MNDPTIVSGCSGIGGLDKGFKDVGFRTVCYIENAACGGWWNVEPDVGRVAHGVPNRVDRIKVLGNAVVPQVAEEIARFIKHVLK